MLDLGSVFCTAQNVFSAGTTVTSTDWIDGRVAQNWGDGFEPAVEIIVTTTFVGGTSVQFQLTAVDAAGANPVVIESTLPIAVAGLVAAGAGVPPATQPTKLVFRVNPRATLPTSTLTNLRLQAVSVGTTTQGAITARMVSQPASMEPGKAHASGW